MKEEFEQGKDKLNRQTGLLFLILTSTVVAFYLFVFVPQDSFSIHTNKKCTVVDNDGSFDDLRSLLLLACSPDISATHFIFTEGIVKPEHSVRNYLYLKKKHEIKEGPVVIIGEKSERQLETNWKRVRERDRSLNSYFVKNKKSKQALVRSKEKIKFESIGKECEEIDLLILGPYTSAVKYWEIIKDKVSRVVTMGGREQKYFNCWYDEKACKNFFSMAPDDIVSSINIPASSPSSEHYGFDQKFINSLDKKGKLGLWREIFEADPSGWKPKEILMWDDLTSFFFFRKRGFKKFGGYWEPLSDPSFFRNEWKKIIRNCQSVR